ncbi:MAG: hypothetical protein ACPL88_00460, partial [Bryobacteraceae bacterium]
YEVLGVPPPVWRPRPSCTLVDPRSARLMARYGLRFARLLGGEQAVREIIAPSLRPPALVEAVSRSRAEVVAALDRVRTQVSVWGGPVVKAIEKSSGKILYQLGKIERRIAREALRRDEQASRDIVWLCNRLAPRRRLQERVYGIVALMAAHGPQVVERLWDSIAWDCFDHQLVLI